MNQRIDGLDDLTDWIINSPSQLMLNGLDNYVAGYQSLESIMIKFDSTDTIKTASKTYATPFDVSEFDTLVLSVWSQLKTRQDYKKIDDFSYKISINGTTTFYMPIFNTFTSINFSIEGISQITKIEIEAIHTDTDYIIISEMWVERENPALDIMSEIRDQINFTISDELGNGVLITTGISATAGDTKITFASNPNYLERYTAIYIADGVNNEKHQIANTNGLEYYFNDHFDGSTIINTYANATIYLICPVYLNPGQDDLFLPGIAIWDLSPNFILRNTKFDVTFDTFTDDGAQKRRGKQILEYDVQLDIECRSAELLEKYAEIMRRWIARMKLWITGRKHNISFAAPSQHFKPTAGIDIIEKLTYSLKVEYNENINKRITVPYADTINITIQGE